MRRMLLLALAGLNGLFGLVRLELEEVEELADLVIALCGVPHLHPWVERVAAAASDALPRYVAALDQIADDALDGALRDPDLGGDVPQPNLRVARDAEQDLCVVREEPPRRALLVT